MSDRPEPNPEQRALEESRRVLAPGPVDPAAPTNLVWSEMPHAARATCCLTMLLLREELDPSLCRYDPARRVSYVTRPSRYNPGQQTYSSLAVDRTLDQVLAVIRAQFGHRAAEVAALVRRG